MADKFISIIVDKNIYPLEAVEGAGYTFTDKAYVEIKNGSSKRLEVIISPKENAINVKNLKGEFMNELLHHALRLKITAANQKIREYVVTQALFSVQPSAEQQAAIENQDLKDKQPKVLDAELEEEIEKLLSEAEKADYKKDPLGIAVPWEEKYVKSGKKIKKTAKKAAKK